MFLMVRAEEPESPFCAGFSLFAHDRADNNGAAVFRRCWTLFDPEHTVAGAGELHLEICLKVCEFASCARNKH